MTPDQYTAQELFVKVDDGHKLYVQDWGNPSAKMPVIFLHGGPGGGCDNRNKQRFEPENQRVIFFDQRGSGKSLPIGSLNRNTTPDLIEDIEKIAQHLKINKFVLAGGSWGSTLALCYGIAYPKRVAAMIIDGVFTATQSENDWTLGGGWRTFFPDVWAEFMSSVPKEHQDNPSAYHFKRALGKNTEAAKKSAYIFTKMEQAILKLDDQYTLKSFDEYDPSASKIEIHYLANKCFIAERHILNNASKLTMPIHIIQGRYDMVCPPYIAFQLSRALPECQLIWTINGHMRQHEASTVQKMLLRQVT